MNLAAIANLPAKHGYHLLRQIGRQADNYADFVAWSFHEAHKADWPLTTAPRPNVDTEIVVRALVADCIHALVWDGDEPATRDEVASFLKTWCEDDEEGQFDLADLSLVDWNHCAGQFVP